MRTPQAAGANGMLATVPPVWTGGVWVKQTSSLRTPRSFIILRKKIQANTSARMDASGIIQKILVIMIWFDLVLYFTGKSNENKRNRKLF